MGTQKMPGYASLTCSTAVANHAIIEQDGEGYIAYCPKIPGANGQGKTKDEA